MIDKLGGDFVRFTTALISRVFFERVNQEFLRSSSNESSRSNGVSSVDLSFAAASTTLLRAKMEQEEFEEGSHTSRLLIHDAKALYNFKDPSHLKLGLLRLTDST